MKPAISIIPNDELENKEFYRNIDREKNEFHGNKIWEFIFENHLEKEAETL